ncbi:hypothetical protein JTB14_036199 [Gonioctena quinquepunctata]|nr:hypothetical protein JTB14_036199 [Gonioctena quinquepunctata]
MPVRESRADDIRQTGILRKALNLEKRYENSPSQSLEQHAENISRGKSDPRGMGHHGNSNELFPNSENCYSSNIEKQLGAEWRTIDRASNSNTVYRKMDSGQKCRKPECI